MSDWRRAEELNAFLPVARRVRVDDVDVELVKTYADCALTALFFRAPQEAWMQAVPDGPPEIARRGSSSGAPDGEVHVMECGPVHRDRTGISVAFRRASEPGIWVREPIDVPIDRSLTAPHDRGLADNPPPIEASGVRAQLTNVAAGLIRTLADVKVDALDEEILVLRLGQHGLPMHANGGPGPGALWRRWLPPSDPKMTVRREKSGNRITLSASASAQMTLRAVRSSPQKIAKRPPAPLPAQDWLAWSLPGRQPLQARGASGGSGPLSETPGIDTTLFFGAVPPEGDGVEIALEQLWAYRYGGAFATIPSPSPDRSVDLFGAVLETSECRVELIEWEPFENAGYRLRGRFDPPDVQPDVCVIGDSRSAALWSRSGNGELNASLPLNHAPLFEGSTVDLALRMVGRRVDGVTLTGALAPDC